MSEHIQSAAPTPAPVNRQLAQIRAALKDAEDHYAWLMGHCPSNTLALRVQVKLITQYERQIAELTEGDWVQI